MSDMQRPYPLPTAPDHELHDPLLVAQYVAGDPLQADEYGKAQLWTTSCGACASLAEDLRAVSGAVAWEPVPPRRRDFRLDETQAERLRGNPLTRLMRRLALPQSRMLRPAAAGVMSIGILLVAAGTVLPDDEFVLQSVQPVAAPAETPMELDGLVVEPVPDGALRMSASPAPLPAGDDFERARPDEEDLAENLAEAGVPELADDAAEIAAGADAFSPPRQAADELARKSLDQDQQDRIVGLGAEAANSSVTLDDDGQIVVPEGPESETSEDATIAGQVEDVAMPAAGEVFTQGGDATDPRETSVREALEDSSTASRSEAAADVGSNGSLTSGPVDDDGLDVQAFLVALGLALAVIGGVLLLLVWIARRRTDPLLG